MNWAWITICVLGCAFLVNGLQELDENGYLYPTPDKPFPPPTTPRITTRTVTNKVISSTGPTYLPPNPTRATQNVVVTQKPTQKPIVTSKTTQKPIVTSKTTQRQIVTQTTTQRPIVTSKPVVVKQQDDVQKPTTQRTVQTTGYNYDKPAIQLDEQKTSKATSKPFVTQKQTQRPIVTQKSTQRPVVTQKQTQRPIVTQKPTQRPVVTQKQTQRPVVTQKPTQKPIVTPKPVVVKQQVDVQKPTTQRTVQTTGYNYDKPAIQFEEQRTTKAAPKPVVTPKPTQRPIVTQKQTQRPIVTQKQTQRPIVTQKPTQRPVVTQKQTQRPVVTQKQTQRPIVTSKTTQRPIVTPKPVVVKQQVDVQKPTTQRTVQTTGYNYDKPAIQFEEQRTTKAAPKPIVTPKPTQRPIVTQKPTQRPIVTQKQTQRPIATPKPVVVKQQVDVQKPTTQRTVQTTGYNYDKPAIQLDEQKTTKATPKPFVTQKPTQRPIVTSKTTQRPIVTQKPTQRPIVTSKTTQRPIVTQKQTQRPIVTQKPTQRPIATPKPLVVKQQVDVQKPTTQRTVQTTGYNYDKPAIQFEEQRTTKAAPKPIVTPKPTQRPIVTQKPTQRPVVTQKQTQRPIVTQKPTQRPIVTPKPVVVKQQVDVQKPTTQRTVQTTGYNYDKPAIQFEEQRTTKAAPKPIVTPKPTQRPIVTQKPTQRPIVTQKQTQRPIATPKPVVVKQQVDVQKPTTQRTVQTTGYNYDKPAIQLDEQKTTKATPKPFVTQKPTQRPIVTSKTTQRPIVTQKQTQRPIVTQKPTQRPIATPKPLVVKQQVDVQKPTTQRTVQTTGYNYDKPAIQFEEQRTTKAAPKPIVTPKPTQRPIVTQKTTQRPIATPKPVVVKQQVDVQKPTTQRTVQTTGYNYDKPAIQLDEQKTTKASPKPFVTQKQTQRPIVTSKTTQRPIVTQKPTQRPVVTQKQTQRPIVTQKPTQRPIVTQKPTQRPIVTQKQTQRPIVTQKPTQRPIATPKPVVVKQQVDVQKPTTQRTVQTTGYNYDKPAIQFEEQRTTKAAPKPIATPKPTQRPIVTQKQTQRPIVTQKQTQRPIVTQKPTQRPIATPKPVVVKQQVDVQKPTTQRTVQTTGYNYDKPAIQLDEQKTTKASPKPFVTQKQTQRPIVTSKTTQRPIVTQKQTQRPIVTQKPTQRPIATPKPVVVKQQVDVQKPTTQRTVQTTGYNYDKPAIQLDEQKTTKATPKPFVTQKQTQKPIVTPKPTRPISSPKPTVARVITSTGPTYLPPNPTRATQKSVVTQKPTQRPIVTSKPTQRPIVTQKQTQRPIVTQKQTQRPIVTPKPIVVKQQDDVQKPTTQRTVQTTGYNYDKPAVALFIKKDTVGSQNSIILQKSKIAVKSTPGVTYLPADELPKTTPKPLQKITQKVTEKLVKITTTTAKPRTTPKVVTTSTQGNTYLPPVDNTTPQYKIKETTRAVVVTKTPSIERIQPGIKTTPPSKVIENSTKKSTPGPSYLPIEQPKTVPRSYVTRTYKPQTYVPIVYKSVSQTPYPTFSRRSTTTQVFTTTPQYLYRRPVKEFKDGN